MQHHIVSPVARLVDAGIPTTTATRELGPVNAANLREAHRILESGTSIGKITLAGFRHAGVTSRGSAARYLARERSALSAACRPHMPCTPAPGGVAAEHRYTPGTPVKYGSRAARGRTTVCSTVAAPVAMSPPT